ncbi:cupin domain-containing protein [Xanthobacter dioxanivorans]|uniref:Cupin domain-containing protein n=1 Tax=Xanthobacter dioxanivorans TaxID=2528964 RepID=A0A974PNN6_9HYPH|nr:ChrR family anti-sigma-E factor [Xanthobacter dioxanivorans]QRG06514.1 cupin domain-containing protein [Xanthobacter dioxanivorans]
MSVSSHPSDETLLRHAAGTLPAGPKLVVDLHAAGCPRCREMIRDLEAVGGTLLEGMAEVPLASDAFARVMARADLPELRKPIVPPPALPVPRGLVLPGGIALPSQLAARRIGALRPVAPGVRMGKVHVPEDPGTRVLLFHIGPGRSIPEHTHDGLEYTHILCGSFSDQTGRYGPGDLVEADAQIAHTPRVDETGDCVCIAAFEGRLRFSGLLGVALRPFF